MAMLNNDPNIHTIRLRDFYEDATDIYFTVDNREVFMPEVSWTQTFATGLQQVDLAGAVVLEVGVGSGINMAGLMLSPKKPSQYIGLDLVPAAVEASRTLAAREGIKNVEFFESDLLEAVKYGGALLPVDYIIGCIPQVPRRKDEILNDRDLSDYYIETGLKEDVYGLGLVVKLLKQWQEHAPHARIILNIGGRQDGRILSGVFRRAGFEWHMIYKNVVQQDPTTSLEAFVQIEEDDLIPTDFMFYTKLSDPVNGYGLDPVNAKKAEALRLKNVPVYHNVFVSEFFPK